MTATVKQGMPWSPSEIAQLKSMLGQQCDRKGIAAQLGRTEEAVAAKLYKLHGRRTAQGSGKRQQRRRKSASFFLS